MTDRSALPDVDPVFYEHMLERWRNDPGTVDESWHALFVANGEVTDAAAPTVPPSTARSEAIDPAELAATVLRRVYRERGHLIADFNPLNRHSNGSLSDLGLDEFGLAPSMVDGDLAAELDAAYCGTLSAEFVHLDDPEPRSWIASAMESGFGAPNADQKKRMLDQLIAAETFEHFMQTKLPTIKRYGLEGSEVQIPLCERLLECAANCGVEEVVLGPMHRGRTTFMALFMEKPLPAIFSEFKGTPWYPPALDIAGDVPFHMGYSSDRQAGGRSIHISMASHPSHVETVIPVSLGKARARQSKMGEAGTEKVLGFMMHTDAGFAGQGVVAETFQLSGLDGYATGGSIHVIANNQLGFTTRERDARTSRYCSDMGKIVQAPVLRVNGDDPEAAFRASTIACAFWQRFHRDIIIDLVCYRRQGHNELDEPRYTQPDMYARIDGLPSVITLYRDRLEAEGVVPPGWSAERRDAHWAAYSKAFEAASTYRPNKPGRFERHWKGLRHRDLETVAKQPATGVPAATLKRLSAAQVRWPEGFAVNRRLTKQLEARAADVEQSEQVGWAAAEALAFASLLAEGVPIRLTGEDTRRGTFSQRHGVLVDENSEAPYVPLNHVVDGQATIEIHDSPLSEEAVLAFEYGHSLADPNTLVVWEAQFGDFANVAQVFIDQYIASGEEKWLRSSGLVLLLPHGLEGGGPEHSSARLERFLQLCAKGNMHVVNCTTPANHFHALRRQMRRDFRKPLIAMTPKLMLRHKQALSGLRELGRGTRFEPVIGDPHAPAGAKRVVLCSGRAYYELDAARTERGVKDIAIVRLEELYPFPASGLRQVLEAHPMAEVKWCQEEPENMGAWSYIAPRVRTVLDEMGRGRAGVVCVARPANPSPAPGFKVEYERQQAAMVEAAFA